MNTDLAFIVITSSELDGAAIYCKRSDCGWEEDNLDGTSLTELINIATQHTDLAHPDPWFTAFHNIANHVATFGQEP